MKKVKSTSFTKGSVAEKLSISAKEAYEKINTQCNDFLKSQKGIKYLLLKYPTLSFSQAILEYYCSAMAADNYDPTCQSE